MKTPEERLNSIEAYVLKLTERVRQLEERQTATDNTLLDMACEVQELAVTVPSSGYSWDTDKLRSSAARMFRGRQRVPASSFRDLSAGWRRLLECLRRTTPDPDAAAALKGAGFAFIREGKFMYIVRLEDSKDHRTGQKRQ